METDYQRLRERMVDEQLVPRGIRDPSTLASMREVPRHLFVPDEMHFAAYDDSPMPIGSGQTISQPYIVALMTEAAEIGSLSEVLEIGTGSGYAAAVLSRMAKQVYTVERIGQLAAQAKLCFSELNYDNIQVKIGDGSLGWLEHSPYDAILVTAGAPVAPKSLLHQLKPSGRLIIPVGEASHQRLVRYRKISDEEFEEETLELVRFVPLIGEEGWSL